LVWSLEALTIALLGSRQACCGRPKTGTSPHKITSYSHLKLKFTGTSPEGTFGMLPSIGAFFLVESSSLAFSFKLASSNSL